MMDLTDEQAALVGQKCYELMDALEGHPKVVVMESLLRVLVYKSLDYGACEHVVCTALADTFDFAREMTQEHSDHSKPNLRIVKDD